MCQVWQPSAAQLSPRPCDQRGPARSPTRTQQTYLVEAMLLTRVPDCLACWRRTGMGLDCCGKGPRRGSASAVGRWAVGTAARCDSEARHGSGWQDAQVDDGTERDPCCRSSGVSGDVGGVCSRDSERHGRCRLAAQHACLPSNGGHVGARETVRIRASVVRWSMGRRQRGGRQQRRESQREGRRTVAMSGRKCKQRAKASLTDRPRHTNTRVHAWDDPGSYPLFLSHPDFSALAATLVRGTRAS